MAGWGGAWLPGCFADCGDAHALVLPPLARPHPSLLPLPSPAALLQVQGGDLATALRLFGEMQEEGLTPNTGGGRGGWVGGTVRL